jgi:hypothetical protein
VENQELKSQGHIYYYFSRQSTARSLGTEQNKCAAQIWNEWISLQTELSGQGCIIYCFCWIKYIFDVIYYANDDDDDIIELHNPIHP